MGDVSIQTAAPERLALSILTHRVSGQIEAATAGFAEKFRFRDEGLGLEFINKQRLAEFFRKAREMHPDCLTAH